MIYKSVQAMFRFFNDYTYVQHFFFKKATFFSLLLSLCFFKIATAQTAENASLLYLWQDPSLVPSTNYNNTYNEIWGFVHDGREYAVIGSTAGTHIFDVTAPSESYEADFVAGAFTGGEVVHRDYHDYNGYLYMVCDEGLGTSTLQIADLQYLPDSVHIVYDSNELFSRSHNIFIDAAKAKLYVCNAVQNDETANGLAVFSLQTPSYPTLLGTYNTVRAHDVYVRDDIAYINGEGNGLFVVDFSDPQNPLALGSLTEYSQYDQGYNHSGWLSDDGQYYVFADENHGFDVKIADVSDLTDIEIVASINAAVDTYSIAHNPIIRGDYLYISYYHDGLQVWNIADPYNPFKVAFYDTYSPPDHASYRGAWGVYPFLPSGNILVSDMQSGLFVLDVNEEGMPTHIIDLPSQSATPGITAHLDPTNNKLIFKTELAHAQFIDLQIINLNGAIVVQEQIWVEAGQSNFQSPLLNSISNQLLIWQAKTESGAFSGKIMLR